jgi:secondary thiamine-phosphate synthase enzyme
MKIIQKEISLPAFSRGFYEITPVVQQVLSGLSGNGTVNVFTKHTSCGLMICENADPSVLTDMDAFFRKISPEGNSYIHSDEGPDDMPAHIRSMLTGVSLTIPLTNGRLNLGTWQGIYLCEFRSGKRNRTIVITVVADEVR